MSYAHGIGRPGLLSACAALLFTACLPPLAFQDGMTAWTPEPGRTEASLGIHRGYVPGGTLNLLDGQFPYEGVAINYLVPTVRYGFGQAPLAGEIGATSVVLLGAGGPLLLLGPMVGVGYRGADLLLTCRAYVDVLAASRDTVMAGYEWSQASVLLGSSHRAEQFHFAGGLRLSPLAGGPVLVLGRRFGPLDLRAEGSYMTPVTFASTGQLWSLGLTIGAPSTPGTEMEE